jgi:hypothetical protein
MTMISILDTYYDDPRPKILIFPERTVAQNFYSELMDKRFSSKYKTYVIKRLGEGIVKKAMSRDKDTKRKAQKEIEAILAMKGELKRAGQPGYLRAPMRAYRYSIVGGRTVFRGALPPNDPVFKIGYTSTRKNPLDNKIIMMDEVHNMVHLSASVRKFKDKIDTLRNGLYTCESSVVVGFTATPIVDKKEDGDRLLKVIKGQKDAGKNNEGYISYYNSLPSALYPTVRPDIAPKTGKIAQVLIFPVLGENFDKNEKANLGAYTHHAKKLKFPPSTGTDLQPYRKLFNYINLSSSYSHITQSKWHEKYKADPVKHGNKMSQLIERIISKKEKTLVLVERGFGFKAFKIAFEEAAKRGNYNTPKKSWCSMYDKITPCLSVFNSEENKTGKEVLTMVVDASKFSEGVSFFGVRAIYLLNPPLTYGLYQQQIGRVLRACAYENLPKPSRNVSIYICVGDTGNKVPSIDQMALNSLLKQRVQKDKEMNFFKRYAVDNRILDKFFNK